MCSLKTRKQRTQNCNCTFCFVLAHNFDILSLEKHLTRRVKRTYLRVLLRIVWQRFNDVLKELLPSSGLKCKLARNKQNSTLFEDILGAFGHLTMPRVDESGVRLSRRTGRTTCCRLSQMEGIWVQETVVFVGLDTADIGLLVPVCEMFMVREDGRFFF